MNRILLLLGLIFTTLAGSAQTNFDQWNTFRSTRFGFSIDYPSNWLLNETSDGDFAFKNDKANRGTFRIQVKDEMDSARAAQVLEDLRDRTGGSRFNKVGEKNILMYKTVVMKSGSESETHFWVVQHGKLLITCSFTYNVNLRKNPALEEELKLSYQMIETLKFF